MRERGPFTDRIKREMKEDGLKYGLMLHGDMAYKYPKKNDRVSNYLRPMILKGVKRSKMEHQNEISIVTIPDQ